MSTLGRQAQLAAKIEKLKQELLTLRDLRPGTLSEQYNVCGKAACACKADPPRKHGPYYQVSFTWQGRSRTQFVRGENVVAMRQQLRNYERLRELVEAWIAAGLELSSLRFGAPTSSRGGRPKTVRTGIRANSPMKSAEAAGGGRRLPSRN